MASVNKAIIVGNLGRDPEVRYTQSGQAVATLFLSLRPETWMDRDRREPGTHRLAQYRSVGQAG